MTRRQQRLILQDWIGSRLDAVAWGRRLANLLNTLAVLFWTLLGLKGITTLDLSWDSAFYHLPFAARLLGIFPKSEFLFYPRLDPLYDGVPKLAETVQGLLWRVTGLVSAPNLFGWACLLALAILTARQLRVGFWLATLFFLSVPLVLLHTVTSYVDLPANAFIALAFLNLLAALDDKRFDAKRLFLTLAPLAAAANIKYQALLIAMPVWLLTVVVIVLQERQRAAPATAPQERRRRWMIIGVNVVCALLLGAGYLVNLVRFNNPFYPLAVRLGPISLAGPFVGPGDLNARFAGTRPGRITFKGYLVSLSEIRLWTENRGVLWSVDMGAVLPYEEPYWKSGGFFVVNLLLWGGFVLVSAAYATEAALWRRLGLVAACFFFIGWLPSGILLRYWMFLPLILVMLVFWTYRRNTDRLRPLFQMVVMLQFASLSFVLYQLRYEVLPRPQVLSELSAGLENLRSIARTHRLHVESPGFVCVVTLDPRQGFWFKLANPDLAIEETLEAEACQSDTIIRQ